MEAFEFLSDLTGALTLQCWQQLPQCPGLFDPAKQLRGKALAPTNSLQGFRIQILQPQTPKYLQLFLWGNRHVGL